MGELGAIVLSVVLGALVLLLVAGGLLASAKSGEDGDL